MLRTVRYSFEQVRMTKIKDGPCPVCEVHTTRQKRFEHTVNPFNTRADGEVKTREEVREDVKAEAEAWTPDFTHGKCRTEGRI